jgi:hypothetical protein
MSSTTVIIGLDSAWAASTVLGLTSGRGCPDLLGQLTTIGLDLIRTVYW